MSQEAPRVDLSAEAQLEGSIVSHNDQTVLQFLGIPFAEPPLGNLRFKNPVPAKLWSGVKEATVFGKVPAQNLSRYRNLPIPMVIPSSCSEDCLYLNVWTPTTDKNAKLAVMVWVYGGAFISGWSDHYKGTVFSADHGVVFVSFNYRLGPFGYVTNGTEEYPGNMGLMDQIAALQWVQQHIHNFGGDPDNVTIFGESAGGASVAMLMLSDLAQGLFHRGISQSGVLGTMELKTSKTVAAELKTFLQARDEGKTEEFDVVKYLSEKTTDEILILFLETRVIPTQDGKFLRAKPEKLFVDPNLRPPKQYMLGCNSTEGALYTVGPLAALDMSSYQAIKESVRFVVGGRLGPEVEPEAVATALMKRYIGSDGDVMSKEDMVKGLAILLGDALFVIPTARAAAVYADKCPTYLYHFDYRPSFSPHPQWVRADHTFDVPFVLGDVLTPEMKDLKPTEEDKQISKLMMKYWANFAKTGDPNSEDLANWPRFTQDSPSYMEFADVSQVKKDFKKDELSFWNNLQNQGVA